MSSPRPHAGAYRTVRLAHALLLGLILPLSFPAQAHSGICTYGLAPTGLKARWVSAEAKQVRARAVQAAWHLWGAVAGEVPLSSVAADLAGLLLLHLPALSAPPKWRITARNGSLVLLGDDGVLRRQPEGLVGTFSAGADLALDLHAISLRGRLSRLVLLVTGGHPRLRLELQQPVDVARLHMRAEKDCSIIELRLDEP